MIIKSKIKSKKLLHDFLNSFREQKVDKLKPKTADFKNVTSLVIVNYLVLKMKAVATFT